MELKVAALDTLKRVRWNVVFGLLVVLVVVAFLLFGNPLKPTYMGEGDIKMRTWLEPETVSLTDESTAWAELINRGEKRYNITVFMSAKSKEITFTQTGAGNIEKSILIGPGESRSIPFALSINAEYEGSYGIDVDASYGREKITEEIYLVVEED